MNIIASRLHNQRLLRPLPDAPSVVGHLGAVQSQDYYGAAWALSLRLRDTTKADIDKLYNDGSILRTHVMRPT